MSRADFSDYPPCHQRRMRSLAGGAWLDWYFYTSHFKRMAERLDVNSMGETFGET